MRADVKEQFPFTFAQATTTTIHHVMSAELVLAVVGLIEGSIKLAKKIKTTLRTYQNADEGINEKVTLVEALWTKVEIQLKFLSKISEHLTEDLAQSQLNLLQKLQGKLSQTVSQLEIVSPKNAAHKGKTIDVRRKWKFTLVKSSLDELVAELEAWQQRFDPTWYLIILMGGTILDTALLESKKDDVARSRQVSDPLSNILDLRSALNPDLARQSDTNTNINLGAKGLKGGQESRIPFTTAKAVVGAPGSSNLLIVESIACPPGTAPQVKIDVESLARKLKQVDPDTFGLLKCYGILKHRDSATNKLSAIDVIYRTPLHCQPPQTLRHHLLKQNPVSLSAIMQIAKQLVRSVHYVHTCGFVHKNIRPENILIFPSGDDLSLGLSFLVGFTQFRNANFQTNLYGDVAWHRNLYRHPQRQGALVLERYVMQHDIYSLGVCLLEIGLWRSFVWYPSYDGNATPVPGLALGFSLSDKDFEAMKLTGQKRTQEQLVALAKKELPPRVGDSYTNIAIACMTCLDPNNGTFGLEEELMDEDGITVGVKFVEHILSRIIEISV
ncbi:hypothetical protein HD806DRAFT_512236 [Xylariaceae sp. AK1471]|nr:hypothetical protein HD806DRAFT_512236 [Xylariaceae sp. AK1471]